MAEVWGIRRPMSRFGILFIRYVAAIVVSYVVSFAVFGFTLFVAGSLLPGHDEASELATYIGIAVVGFCGVFLGALLLERASRRVGSIILLFLGLAFYLFLCYPMDLSSGSDAKNPNYFLRWLVPLSVGGFLAVTLIFLIFRQQQPNATPKPN